MHTDENTDFKNLKTKLFFSTLFSKLLFGIIWLFFGIWQVIKFIFSPIALIIQLFILVPLIYFTNKQDTDMNLVEIDMDVLHDEVFEEIQESIAIFETYGFTSIKLVQGHLPDPKGTIFTQLMLNESKGIALALMYGVFKDENNEYSNIQISYEEFAFETSDGEEFEFHNAPKESIVLTNRVTRLYIDEYIAKIMYEKVLDIVENMDIVVNKDTMEKIKNDPISMIKKDYQTDMTYLVEIGYLKRKDNYLRPSIKASVEGVFKEMWPVSSYYTKKSWKRTLAYLNSIGFDIEKKDYWTPSASEIPLDNKITTIKDIEAFLSTYPTMHLQPTMIEFRLDDTENIEETIIYLAHKKPIGRKKCIFTDNELTLSNSDNTCYTYENLNIEIGHCSSEKYIKEFQNILSPKEIVALIKEKYDYSYIDNILLTPERYEVLVEMEDNDKIPYETLYIDYKSGERITSVETF